MQGAWEGLKNLTGLNKPRASQSTLTDEEREDFANRLNTFYCRFERDDLGDERQSVLDQVKEREREGGNDFDFEIDELAVKNVFRKLNVRKAVGPDGVGGKLLKFCCNELAGVFSKIFCLVS